MSVSRRLLSQLGHITFHFAYNGT